MKKKIAVVTGTRAEYGLLFWIMKGIQQSDSLELQLIVTGSHLSPAFGNTYEMIEDDGFLIDQKIDMLVSGDTPVSVVKSMGLGLIGFAQAYKDLQPDLLMVLGDRYEILAAVSATIPFNIPVAHIHGGEITEGAMDEQIRHAVTKMSHLHFTSTKEYAQNIRRMGEESWRIFCTGAPGLEWVHHNDCLSKEQLEKEINVDFDKGVILAAFHPVTLERENTPEYIDALLQALIICDMQVIFTGANADPLGALINKKVKETALNYSNIHWFENLGQIKFLSCMKYCSLMIGNSSAGIIEAASFGLSVVNIGNRQKGRMQSGNVIDIGYSVEQIVAGIFKAKSQKFKTFAKSVTNVYGDGNVSHKIISILENINLTRLKYKRLTYD